MKREKAQREKQVIRSGGSRIVKPEPEPKPQSGSNKSKGSEEMTDAGNA